MLENVQNLDGGMPSDAECVLDTLRGESRAFEQIVSVYHGRVFGFLMRMVKHQQDAEDLTQQTFVKAFQSLQGFQPDRPLINWLLTIARNNALNFFRSAKDWEPISEEMPAGDLSPAGAVAQWDGADDIWERVRLLLPPRQFEVLWLRYGEDLSVKETAQVVGLSQTHVKILVFRARRRLLKGEIKL
jgi:RNA polymerase sigma-70 factor (ECF subfamily)